MVLIPKAVSGILCTQWKKWEVCLSVSRYLSFHILTFHLTFLWHFVFGVLLKFVDVLQFLVKIWQQLQTIYPNVSYSCAHLVQHPKNKWEQKMLGTKLVEKMKHILYTVCSFFRYCSFLCICMLCHLLTPELLTYLPHLFCCAFIREYQTLAFSRWESACNSRVNMS